MYDTCMYIHHYIYHIHAILYFKRFFLYVCIFVFVRLSSELVLRILLTLANTKTFDWKLCVRSELVVQ